MRVGVAVAARRLVEVLLAVVTLTAAGEIPHRTGRVAAVTAGTADFFVSGAGERDVADLAGVALDAIAVGKPGTFRRDRRGRREEYTTQEKSSEQRGNSLLHRHSPFSLGSTHILSEKARDDRQTTRLEPGNLYWLEGSFVKFPH